MKRDSYVDMRVQGRARLRLYGDSNLSRMIFCHGFEQNEQAFLWRYLRPGDVFVDVGSNIGLFTIIAAKRVGESGKVFAFEPAAIPRQRLVENIRLNRFANVSVQPMALSNESGRLEISVPTDGYDAWSSLATPIEGTNLRIENVEIITWDEFAALHNGVKPVMMKIDVEGWENRVLNGATKALSDADAPLLQVEFTDEAALSAGSSCALVYQTLLELGYVVCRYDRRSNRLIPEQLRPSYPYENLFATKRLDVDNQRLMVGSHISYCRLQMKKYCNAMPHIR